MFTLKMAKLQSGSEMTVGIFREIGPLHDRFKASRVVSGSNLNICVTRNIDDWNFISKLVHPYLRNG